MQLCAGRVHLQSDLSKRRKDFIRKTLHASTCAEDCTQQKYWQSQQQQQPDTLEGPSSAGIGNPLREGFEPTEEKEEPEFAVDLRIEGIAQDVILKDEERMGKMKEAVGKSRIGYQPKGKSNWFDKEESKTSTSKATLNCMNWDTYPELSSAILA